MSTAFFVSVNYDIHFSISDSESRNVCKRYETFVNVYPIL